MRWKAVAVNFDVIYRKNKIFDCVFRSLNHNKVSPMIEAGKFPIHLPHPPFPLHILLQRA